MSTAAQLLAIDLGASSGRSLLGKWDGTNIQIQELHRFANDPVWLQGHWHWNILQLWSNIQTSLTLAVQQHNDSLTSIGIDTWGLDFGLLDRAGRLLGSPYMYRDARTEHALAQVFTRISRHELFQRTGIECMRVNTLYQLWAMAQTVDPQLEAAETLLMLPDLLRYWLTGERSAEYTIATTSQMIDCQTRNWATDLLLQLDLRPDLLPPLIAPGTIAGQTKIFGLSKTIPVVAVAGHDTASAVVAIPDLDAQSVYISSGTWSLMGIEGNHPIVSDAALQMNMTNEGGFAGTVRLQKNITGLWLLQESRRQWQREGQTYTWEQLLLLAQAVPPFRSLIDPDAPTFSQPGNLPQAIRTYCKHTGQAEPDSVGAVVRCCLESLALRYRQVVEQFEELTGRRLTTIRIVGGGCQNTLLCQMTANACQRTVVAGPVEATALGNLMVQLLAIGWLPNLAAARSAVARSVTRQVYQPQHEADWDAATTRFTHLHAHGELPR
jgi:rhamnulokinase